MSQYINLDDDPEVYYYMNFGHSEAYIVKPEAERIDIVRCKDCTNCSSFDDQTIGLLCSIWGRFTSEDTFCSYGERRADDEH